MQGTAILITCPVTGEHLYNHLVVKLFLSLQLEMVEIYKTYQFVTLWWKLGANGGIKIWRENNTWNPISTTHIYKYIHIFFYFVVWHLKNRVSCASMLDISWSLKLQQKVGGPGDSSIYNYDSGIIWLPNIHFFHNKDFLFSVKTRNIYRSGDRVLMTTPEIITQSIKFYDFTENNIVFKQRMTKLPISMWYQWA